MAHMVIFQSTDGSPGYHQCDGIEDAVKYVEELRNDRGIDRARIFRMEEVEFEFRPYWFVVQRELAAAAAAAPAAPAAPAMPPPAPSSMVAEPEALAAPDRPVVEVPVAEVPAAEDAAGEAEPEAPAHVPATPVDPFAPPPPPPSRGLFGR